MRLTPDMQVLPAENNEFIIYAPVTGRILRVNEDFLIQLKQAIARGFDSLPASELEVYKKNGLIIDNKASPVKDIAAPDPTSITVFPTSDCNLRCIYCYADAGFERKTVEMDVVKSGIDFVVENLLRTNDKELRLSFHGGGEPTYAWGILKGTVEYAQKITLENKLQLHVGLSTNGVLNKEKIDWLVKNVNSVQISMDGPEEIQNRQRPLYSCEGIDVHSSYDAVMATIQRFHEENFNFGIRATVTSESVGQLEEVAAFFNEKVHPVSIHLEPLFECGRCKKTKAQAPDYGLFYKKFISATKIKDLHSKIVTSAGAMRFKKRFCGAAGHNFCITPEGYVSACFEVSLKSDPQSGIFFYGQFNPTTKSFDIDKSKQNLLFSRTVENMPGCRDCFIKWSCAGDCLVKVSRNGDLFNTLEYNKCSLNKVMAQYLIENIVDAEDKNE